MDGIADSLKLGWDALLLRDKAYEDMRVSQNPVVKGLILIVVVGLIVAVAAFVGDVLEWASTPDLDKIKDIVLYYMTQMPWWNEAARSPEFTQMFDQIWNFNWSLAQTLSPNPGNGALGIILMPLGLILRWLIYGVLAYLFARWLGGTGNLSETLGVLALAVAPQALTVLTLIPFVQLGNVIAVWGVLCAYIGLKTAHKLPWTRAAWATVLPFLLFIAASFLAGCLGSAIFAALVKGG